MTAHWRAVRATSRSQDGGFTVLEVMVALAVLSIVSAALAGAMGGGVRSAVQLQRRQSAISLAEQVMEQATAVSTTADAAGCVPLLQGRGQGAVTAQWAAPPDGVDLTSMDPAWNPSTCPATVAVPLSGIDTPVPDDGVTPAWEKHGAQYVVRTLIGTCRMPRTGGTCTQATLAPLDSVLLYRVVVAVHWTGTCVSGCRYLLTELVDPSPDPVFNSRTVAAPVAADDAVCTPAGTKVMVNLLTNDSGALGASPVEVITAPAHGTLGATVSTGYASFTPTVGIADVTDTFTYRLTGLDGRLSAPATVTVAIPAAGCP